MDINTTKMQRIPPPPPKPPRPSHTVTKPILTKLEMKIYLVLLAIAMLSPWFMVLYKAILGACGS